MQTTPQTGTPNAPFSSSRSGSSRKPAKKKTGRSRPLELPAVRLATAADAQALKALVVATHKHPFLAELDFSDCSPYWLIAGMYGVAVGCLEVLPGKPIGRLEYLSVSDDVDQRSRAIIVKSLCYAGMMTLKAMGAQAQSIVVGHEHKGFKKALKNRGHVVIGSGNLMLKDLR